MYPGSVGPFEVLKLPGNSGSRSTVRAITDLGALAHNVDRKITTFAIVEGEVLWDKVFGLGWELTLVKESMLRFARTKRNKPNESTPPKAKY